MSSDLKPCPFCGGEASPDGVTRRSSSPDCRWADDNTECLEAFFCNCIQCGTKNGSSIAGGFKTREQAIAHWNTRVGGAQ